MTQSKLFLGALIAIALSAAGCSGCTALQSLTSGQPVLQGQVATQVGDAMNVAEAAVLGLNTAATQAVSSGLITKGSPTAVKIADALVLVQNARKTAEAAYAAGNAADTASKIGALQTAISAAYQLIPQKKAST